MNQNHARHPWKRLTAGLIVGAASIAGMSALTGCDRLDNTTGASALVPYAGAQPVSIASTKDALQLRLSANHNETFIVV